MYSTPMPLARYHQGRYDSPKEAICFMHEPTELIIVSVLQESLRLLQMCSRKASLEAV